MSGDTLQGSFAFSRGQCCNSCPTEGWYHPDQSNLQTLSCACSSSAQGQRSLPTSDTFGLFVIRNPGAGSSDVHAVFSQSQVSALPSLQHCNHEHVRFSPMLHGPITSSMQKLVVAPAFAIVASSLVLIRCVQRYQAALVSSEPLCSRHIFIVIAGACAR